MGYNNRGGYNNGGQQQEKLNIPLGGERKSSMFFENNKGKLVARGTFDAQAMHQAIEQAVNDPRNSKPGMISVALFNTDKPQFGILVCSPVRQSTGGAQQGGFQRQDGWQQNAPVQQAYSTPPHAAPVQQWGQPQQQGQWQVTNQPTGQPPWGQQIVTTTGAPSFQERYAQPEPEAPAKKPTAKKAAAKKPVAKKGK